MDALARRRRERYSIKWIDISSIMIPCCSRSCSCCCWCRGGLCRDVLWINVVPPSCIIKRTVGCEASMDVLRTQREASQRERGVQPRGTTIGNNTPEQWKQWTTCRQLSTDFPSHEYYYQLRVSQCYHITCRPPSWHYASLAGTVIILKSLLPHPFGRQTDKDTWALFVQVVKYMSKRPTLRESSFSALN